MKQSVKAMFGLRGVRRKTALRRGGYTLTEIAIVLGVISIMLGGIWGAAGVARYRAELNQSVDELGAIVVNMRALYSGQNSSNAPAIALPGLALVQQGVYPRDMLVPTPAPGAVPAAGTIANHLWDQNTPGGSAQLAVAPGQFTIEFQKIPSDVCTDLLVKSSLSPTETGLRQILVGGVSQGMTSNNTLPLTPTTAAGACPTGNTYKIDWVYGLGS